jgi:hypothetical protein
MTKTFGNFTDLMDFSRASTATFLGSDGLIQTAAADIPRIEYDADGTVKGLLIEEARTNLIEYSVVDDTPYWDLISQGTGSVPVRTINHATAPDGTTTAARLQCDLNGGTTSSDRSYLTHNSVTATVGLDYTFSVWLKSADGTTYDIHISISGGGSQTVQVTNEWQRFDATWETTVTNINTRVGLQGNLNTSDTADILVWGAQLEEASFATSYIPTSGAAATRSKDIASIDVENFGHNQDEGTFVIDFEMKFEAGGSRFPRPFEYGNDSNGDERINVYVTEATSRLAFSVNTNGVGQAGTILTSSVTSPVSGKVALTVKDDDVAICLDGGTVITDTSADITGVGSARNVLQFGEATTGSTNNMNGHIRDFQYYPRRLTNRQLQELTGATNTYDYTTVDAGTITRSPVATGSDLVAYSGFSDTNYLEQPYNPDLDFGTGDFCFMGWVKAGGNSYNYIASYGDGDRTSGYRGWFLRNGAISGTTTSIQFRIASNNGIDISSIPTDQWVFVAAMRSGGVAYIYNNGELETSASHTNNVDVADATLRIGHGGNHSIQGISSIERWSGSLALIRISATAPSAEQIAKIYEDEKVLFQENSQATLYGSSDAVTALAHDDVTNLLHVGTSAGRSVFQGLRRVENTTDAVGAAISASNGLVVEE